MTNALQWLGWVTLICAGLCAAVASVLLKIATSYAPPWFCEGPLAFAGSAVIVYGMGFLLYGYSLKSLHVGVAYVCMVAVAALSLLGYSWIHGDGMGLREVLGTFCVLVGVGLIAWRRT